MRLAAMVASTVLLASLARAPADAAGPAASPSGSTVRVLYAGSLVSTMEHGIGPAFAERTTIPFRGYAGGSNALAMQIRSGLRRADVFVSASPKVDALLTGPANGDHVRWTVAFAQSPLVIGYDPRSRFAPLFRTRPWYEVLRQPGIRIGRTDPRLDPKGALTISLLDRAEAVTHQPGLARAVLGAPDNSAEIEPEDVLVGRLQSGQIDAGFFYSTETNDLRIPSITLPPDMALAAHYTATVLDDAPDRAAAVRFVAFLIGPAGRAILKEHGLELVGPTLDGRMADVPGPLRALVADGGSSGR